MPAIAECLKVVFDRRMPRANAAMTPILRSLGDRQLGSMESVTPSLAKFADKLTVRNGSAVLRLGGSFATGEEGSFPSAESIKQSFMDWTGFECFANKIHMEDFAPGMDAVEMLGQAIGFSKLIEQKLPLPVLPLRFIVSLDKFEGHDQCVFSFHVIRPAESWLAQNLEGYAEPVLTWDSTESVFS